MVTFGRSLALLLAGAGICIGSTRSSSSTIYGYGYSSKTSGCTYSSTRGDKIGYTEYGPYCWESYNSHCGGSSQSPIDLSSSEAESHYVEIEFEANECSSASFYNDGYTWTVNLEDSCPSKLAVHFQHTHYHLEYITFHSPSEHTIGGSRFDGELQLVHQSSPNQFLILSVLLKAKNDDTSTNNFLDFIWGYGTNPLTGVANNATGNWSQIANHHSAHEIATSRNINPYTDVLPASPEYYAYSGSLTTPPCTEDVRWVVMAQTVRMSRTQVQAFRQVMSELNGNATNLNTPGQYGNSRPAQAREGRHVYFYSGSAEHESHSGHSTAKANYFFTEVLLPLAFFASFMALMISAATGLMFAVSFIAHFLMTIFHCLGHRDVIRPLTCASLEAPITWDGIRDPIFSPFCAYMDKLTLSYMRWRFLKSMVLVLEILVAAEKQHTIPDVIDVIITPLSTMTFKSIGIIAVVVVIRTVLSAHMSHEYELLDQDVQKQKIRRKMSRKSHVA